MSSQDHKLRTFPEPPTWKRGASLHHWNRFAAVNDEFVDLHMCDQAALDAQQPGAFGMGNLRIGYYYAALQSVMPAGYSINSFECRFTALSFVGDTLTLSWDSQPESDGFILGLSMRNQHGVETTPGYAKVGLCDTEAPRVSGRTSQQRVPGRYLDKATLELVGTCLPSISAFPVGNNDIRRWTQAVYYPYSPPAEVFEVSLLPSVQLTAPGDFNPFAWHPDRETDNYPWMRGMGSEPGFRGLNGGVKVSHFRDIKAGDTISSTVEFIDAFEKEGSIGAMLFLIDRDTWTNQHDQTVKVTDRTTIYY